MFSIIFLFILGALNLWLYNKDHTLINLVGGVCAIACAYSILMK